MPPLFDHPLYNLVIVGGGAAGLTAAIYAGRAGLNPILLQGQQPGGQLTITTDVENYPGFPLVQGPELMAIMANQAKRSGATLLDDHIHKVDFSKTKEPFFVLQGKKTTYYSRAVVIATGAYAKWLGVPGEKEWQGRGVSACAVCDGPFFKKKSVAVIGGGNTAAEEALYLSAVARSVTLIHRRDTLRAEKILQQRLRERENVSFLWDTVVEKCEKSHFADPLQLSLRNLKTHSHQTLAVDGMFVAIGHTPNTEPFAGQLSLDDHGYIRCVPGKTETAIPGVFAAGDVQDSVYRQAITAAGQGCMAALEAEKYLAHL